jgi:MerR family transcriptional regulator, thiopeptide resistance regulator
MDRHLSPQEVASRFGVSIKALRLYEQRGLLTPMRSEAGWRTYGPVQIARLHQIVALKRLGLSLAQIGELLLGRDDLDAVLALQEQVLSRQSQSVAQALALLRSARAKLASGQALSIDDLANLNTETVMQNLTDEERYKLMKPISDKYFTPEDTEKLRQRKYDQPAITAQWNELFEKAKAFAAANTDPASPEVQYLACRWNALIEQFTGGDDGLRQKVRAVWKDAMHDSKIAPVIPLTPEVSAFMGNALEHLKYGVRAGR